MARTIIGLGGSCHDFAACALVDGRVVSAIADERLSRVRYGLGGSCERPYHYVRRQVPVEAARDALFFGNEMLDPTALPAAARRASYVAVRHHLTHAAWAFYSSPFERAAILVADGCGSVTQHGNEKAHARETTSYWLGTERELTPLGHVEGERVGPADRNEMDALTSNSIGDLYQAVTMAIGFSALHAGKTMAIAAYGDDRFVELFRDNIQLHDHGQFTLRLHEDSSLLARVAEIALQARAKSDFSTLASIAFAGQDAVEYLLNHCLHHLARSTGEMALCFAGGVALNAVYNGKIQQVTPFTHVHIPFAPGDDGTALGAAIVGQLQAGAEAPGRDFTPFLGREYREAECLAATSTLSEASFSVTREEDIAAVVARELEDGKVVAWFQGGSEFGPRALGHRSILAWPGNPRTRDRLNAVKGREWFRPFGPSISAERREALTDTVVESPYMQFAVPVRPDALDQVPAACHVDGSARVQTVRGTSRDLFRSVLVEVGRRTGLHLVLNTSLNGPAEPIVETPQEALRLFPSRQLDSLVIGDVRVCRCRSHCHQS